MTYPADLINDIEDLDTWLNPAVNHGAGQATGSGADAERARHHLLAAFTELDQRLASRRYLLGDQITEADIRLWVTLVRFDVSANAGRTISPGLPEHPNLWAYARDLYQQAAFRATTRFASFTAPGATLADWDSPHGRKTLTTVSVSQIS